MDDSLSSGLNGTLMLYQAVKVRSLLTMHSFHLIERQQYATGSSSCGSVDTQSNSSKVSSLALLVNPPHSNY